MLISSQSGTNRVQNVIQQSFFFIAVKEWKWARPASIIYRRIIWLNCNNSRNFPHQMFLFRRCRAAFPWLYETVQIYVKAKSCRFLRITDWTQGWDPNWKTSFRRAPSCLASAKSTQDTITQVLFGEHQLYYTWIQPGSKISHYGTKLLSLLDYREAENTYGSIYRSYKRWHFGETPHNKQAATINPFLSIAVQITALFFFNQSRF